MKQINVHNETHELVKKLSYQQHKSILDIATEAFELYEQQSTGKVGLAVFAREAVMARVPELVNTVVKKSREELERSERAFREPSILSAEEAAIEDPETDDLPVVPYEEVYPSEAVSEE